MSIYSMVCSVRRLLVNFSSIGINNSTLIENTYHTFSIMFYLFKICIHYLHSHFYSFDPLLHSKILFTMHIKSMLNLSAWQDNWCRSQLLTTWSNTSNSSCYAE